MKRTRLPLFVWICGLTAGMLASGASARQTPSAAADDPVKISVTPLTCVPPVDKDTNAKIVAFVQAPFQPQWVRVYFHAEGELFFHSAQGRGMKKDEEMAFYKDEKGQVYFHPPNHGGDHFHDMTKGHTGSDADSNLGANPSPVGDEYWSMLPKVAPGTTNVVFYVMVVDPDGHQHTSPVMTVPVTGDCPEPKLSNDEKKYAKNLIEGLTGERQSAVPPGFRCDGIVSFVTANGELKPNEECRKCACGIFPVEWVAGAALLGGGIVISNRNHPGGGGVPVSPYRPGPTGR